MQESNFKIIAIRALQDCNEEFTKVLQKDQIYYFYSDYTIEFNIKGIETIKPLNIDSYPENLYNIKGAEKNIQVNLCAIVGKNGSGKSSIIELLFRAINNIACNYKSQRGNPDKTIKANLKFVEGIHVEFYYQTDKIYKIIVTNQTFKVYSFKATGEIGDKSEENTFQLGKLFYTEAVNYSHYAYNSLEFGFNRKKIFVDWLSELFHKNDSYQTPLVLNPMRTDGNFNINRENDLVKQRLLANILRPPSINDTDFRKLGDNLIATDIKFRLSESKEKVDYRDDNGKKRIFSIGIFSRDERSEIIEKLILKISGIKNYNSNLCERKDYKNAEIYLVYKLVFICRKYEGYREFINPDNNRFISEKFDKLVTTIKNDSSHITFKLKQTINYLKDDYINLEDDEKTISIDELSKSIDSRKKKKQSILELIPPPIFDIDIILNSTYQLKPIMFSTLSSGEKQQIYMVSSLLYHLYNLDSVSGKKIKYENVYIVFEEVELYFHPEMQKSFIKYFLNSVERIELKNIKSINICFVTHSPFILSDIPHKNIMFLEVKEGKAVQNHEERKTFGANIHEMLTDNFFMSEGFIGEFAKNKIEETIDWLNEELYEKRKRDKSNSTVIAENKILNHEKLKYYKKVISIIDEPILKTKLMEMLAVLENVN